MENEERNLTLAQIERARDAVSNNRCFFYTPSENHVMEFMELNINSSDEIWPLISDLLSELQPEHRVKTDVNASKNLLPESVFITFIWDSERLKKKVTFTFILLFDNFYYFSLS